MAEYQGDVQLARANRIFARMWGNVRILLRVARSCQERKLDCFSEHSVHPAFERKGERAVSLTIKIVELIVWFSDRNPAC